ncbi:hypothetical protein FBU30_006966 [Linnemannia zychae]|nr:hypothetical protein FBU30_006966 [Linnemannia zychae]
MSDFTNSEQAINNESGVSSKEHSSETMGIKSISELGITESIAERTEEVVDDKGGEKTEGSEGDRVDDNDRSKNEDVVNTISKDGDSIVDKNESNMHDVNKDITEGDNSNNSMEAEVEDEIGDAEYEVERVVGHKYLRGRLHYHLKWNGYDSDENTWEDQDNVFCTDLIEAYWKRREEAGGSRDDPKGKDGVVPKKETISRSQKSNGAKHATAKTKKDRDGDTVMEMAPAKRQKTSSTPKMLRNSSATGGLESIETKDKWIPPKEWTSWEDKIESIQTVERNNQKLLIRLAWKNGKETQHPIEAAHQKCPLKLIQFYESHIKFSQA